MASSWAKVKAKAKSWVHSKKRSTTDVHFEWSDDGLSPRQKADTRAALVPLSPAQSLFRGQAGPAQNLFAAPAGATADPDSAAQINCGQNNPKGKILRPEQLAGGAGVAPAEHWGRAGLPGPHCRHVSQVEERDTHERGVAKQDTCERCLAKYSGSGEEQAVGVLEQMGGEQGSCAPPNSPVSPQGAKQVGAVAVPPKADTATDSTTAPRGGNTQLAGSCHINTLTAEPPQYDRLKQDSKLKGKANEVPDNPSERESPHIPMSKYDHILAAVALPAARPSGGAPWWEKAPAICEQHSGGETQGGRAGRLHQILSAVAIPTTERTPATQTLVEERASESGGDVAGPSDGGDCQRLEAGGSSETSGERAAHLQQGDPAAVGQCEQATDPDMADDAEPPPLVLRRPRPRPALPPAVQQLFAKQDALTAQLLMQEADPAHPPLLTRLENIRALLLESGPFLGDVELESLQGEVEAMAVYAAYAQDERATELDRRLSASLQEEFDQEMAEQLERDNGWPAAAEQDQLVECCICLEEMPTKDCIAACVLAKSDTAIDDGDDGEETAGSDSASSSPGPPFGTCSHWHCIDCLRQYATVKVMDDRTPRIPCARAPEGCPAVFPFENVEWLLGDKETQVYLALLAEASITTKVYCPFDGCTAVMDCAEDERGPDSLCAACKRVFCRACRVAWHAEQTCAQYQSVKEDEPLHVLAKKHHWKPCPKCRTMIERKDGCNFMTCKCGASFCYRCGAAYVSLKGTPTNSHGTPGCKCALFQ